MSTELVAIEAALSVFDKAAAGIKALQDAYSGVIYDVKTKDGMLEAKEARRVIKRPRVDVEKIRLDVGRLLLSKKAEVDGRAKSIISALEALESPISDQITNEEMRLHNEAVARETAERERKETLEARLDALHTMAYEATGLSSASVLRILDEAKEMEIGEDWMEYREKAQAARVGSVAALEGVLAKALAQEAEAEKIKADRAELEALRAKQAEADRIERERVAAEQRAESDRLAAERAEMERQDRERIEAHTKMEREAAAARKAEQDKIALERAELEAAKAAVERERITMEAKQRTEAQRIDAFESWLATHEVIPHGHHDQMLMAWLAGIAWQNDNR